jgi:hypothetical protein
MDKLAAVTMSRYRIDVRFMPPVLV